jgi:hypothetical protein
MTPKNCLDGLSRLNVDSEGAQEEEIVQLGTDIFL